MCLLHHHHLPRRHRSCRHQYPSRYQRNSTLSHRQDKHDKRRMARRLQGNIPHDRGEIHRDAQEDGGSKASDGRYRRSRLTRCLQLERARCLASGASCTTLLWNAPEPENAHKLGPRRRFPRSRFPATRLMCVFAALALLRNATEPENAHKLGPRWSFPR